MPEGTVKLLLLRDRKDLHNSLHFMWSPGTWGCKSFMVLHGTLCCLCHTVMFIHSLTLF